MRRAFLLPGLEMSFSAGFVLALSALFARPAAAASCASPAGLSTCFDANTLWIPAGRASFLTIPDTAVSDPGKISFGVSSELLHRPVLLRASSPDRDGRDIHVLDYAIDTSFFLTFGVIKRLELAIAAPLRVYQSGAGAGAVSSQSAPPLDHDAARDPRVGLAYSLDDVLATRGLGLRVALDTSVPLGDREAFASDRSFTVMPSATLGFQFERLHINSSLGARLRQSVDFGGAHLGNQGFVALGVGVALLDPGWLFVGVEAFGLPPLSDSRAATANALVSDATLFPAEWLASLQSSFGTRGVWTLSLGAGTGIPLSSETLRTSSGSSTSHFLGVTTPDFRSLLVLRFAPERSSSDSARR